MLATVGWAAIRRDTAAIPVSTAHQQDTRGAPASPALLAASFWPPCLMHRPPPRNTLPVLRHREKPPTEGEVHWENPTGGLQGQRVIRGQWLSSSPCALGLASKVQVPVARCGPTVPPCLPSPAAPRLNPLTGSTLAGDKAARTPHTASLPIRYGGSPDGGRWLWRRTPFYSCCTHTPPYWTPCLNQTTNQWDKGRQRQKALSVLPRPRAPGITANPGDNPAPGRKVGRQSPAPLHPPLLPVPCQGPGLGR